VGSVPLQILFLVAASQQTLFYRWENEKWIFHG
jgi:hypothetical protein